MIAPLQEKLMEVPKGFLQDTSTWLTQVFGSNMFYTYLCRLKEVEKYKNLNNPPSDERKKQMIKDEEEYRGMLHYLKDNYADGNMVKLMSAGREVSKDFDLSRYPSKYGDLSKIKKNVRVKYKKQLMDRLGMYSPRTRSIAVYARILAFTIRDILGENCINDEFLIIAYRPKLPHDWLVMDRRTLDQIIEEAVLKTIRVLEHEFIHLIQHFLFPGEIKDPQYTTGDKTKYYSSPLEINPWLITLVGELEREVKKSGEIVTNATLERWIPQQQYFKVLKDIDIKLYQKMVSSFYQLVDERLGITNR